LLDAALVVALVAFVATVAFARFIERRGPALMEEERERRQAAIPDESEPATP
jgi:uncharacterized membrane protein